MATVLSALSSVPGVIGKTVAVVGQGPIGLLFNQCLSRLGAGRIIGIDVREERASRSCLFGATDSIAGGRVDPVEAVRELTGGAMADLVVEAVGHEEQALNLCIDLCRDSGHLLYFGVPPDRLNDVAWNNRVPQAADDQTEHALGLAAVRAARVAVDPPGSDRHVAADHAPLCVRGRPARVRDLPRPPRRRAEGHDRLLIVLPRSHYCAGPV